MATEGLRSEIWHWDSKPVGLGRRVSEGVNYRRENPGITRGT